MCGICGIIGFEQRERIIPMTMAMNHRGPDDYGIMMGNNICLGMTRLAVQDLSPSGHQPMWNEEKTVCIVYNGEFYNFQEERAKLELNGYRFVSKSDTEVVLRLYEYYGLDFLQKMRGMFALAIYDKTRGEGRERVLLARDQFGIKPLLYARTGKGLVFASEMKAILASGLVERTINTAALPLLMIKGSIPQPMTMVEGVEMLLPGHRLLLESGKMCVERYWVLAVNRYPELMRADYSEQVALVRSTLEESVRHQMVSDVPIGAFLSGGIDSSLLVSMMARHSSRRVKTFSIGFGSEGASMDETDDAAVIAGYVGTDHTRVEISGQQVRDRINHIVSALDQPSVDGVNSYLVSMAAKQAVTVAISGTGGDELFAGYPWFLNMYRFVQSEGIRDFALRYAKEYEIYGVDESIGLLAPDILASFDSSNFLYNYALQADELAEAEPLERVSALCLRGYTQNQLLRDIDAVSMAHSLEVRVPFLDPVLTDIALSLPFMAKLNPDISSLDPYAPTYRQSGIKRVLVEIGKDFLPPDMDNQPKRGFGMPFGVWMNGPLREVVEDTLSLKTVSDRGIFDPMVVKSIHSKFSDNRIGWAQPWLCMVTELWCRNVLNNK